MRFERSAGVVVFRKNKGATEYLLLQNSSKFFWDFPKGNIDAGESEEDAAMRELSEEAGFRKAKLVPGFKEKMEYFYTFEGEKIHKVVTMFLGESVGEDVRLSWEHSDYRWVAFDVGRTMMKDRKKVMLEKAHRFLSGRLAEWAR